MQNFSFFEITNVQEVDGGNLPPKSFAYDGILGLGLDSIPLSAEITRPDNSKTLIAAMK